MSLEKGLMIVKISLLATILGLFDYAQMVLANEEKRSDLVGDFAGEIFTNGKGMKIASSNNESLSEVRQDRWRQTTFHMGIGSSKTWALVGITAEFGIGNHMSYFLTGALGYPVFGAGIAFYSNRSGNGLVVSGTVGLLSANANITYQLKVRQGKYVVLGASEVLDWFSDRRRGESEASPLLPVVSYEHRF